MNTKTKIDIAFYETKWFKLICLFTFFGWLFYMTYHPFEVRADKLTTINVTANTKWERGSSRNPYKLYFTTREYTNRFGIYVGGTFGRWTEVKEAIEQGGRFTIKISKNEMKNLNNAKEAIPVFYLRSDNAGLIFNEAAFNQGEKSSDQRYFGLLLILFIACLWKIVRE